MAVSLLGASRRLSVAFLAGVAMFGAAILGACGTHTRLETAEPPLAEVRVAVDGSEAWARLAAGIGINQLIDLSFVEAFRLGVDPDAARRICGDPVRVAHVGLETISTFVKQGRVIEIIETHERSSVDETIATHYQLRIPVEDPAFSNSLPKPVRNLWRADKRRIRVALVSEIRTEPTILFNIAAGRVTSVGVAWERSTTTR